MCKTQSLLLNFELNSFVHKKLIAIKPNIQNRGYLISCDIKANINF